RLRSTTRTISNDLIAENGFQRLGITQVPQRLRRSTTRTIRKSLIAENGFQRLACHFSGCGDGGAEPQKLIGRSGNEPTLPFPHLEYFLAEAGFGFGVIRGQAVTPHGGGQGEAELQE